MSDYWTDNGIEKPQQIVVCAACKYDFTVLCGARHWDSVMREQFRLFVSTGNTAGSGLFEQGFIDQFGDFLTREQALKIVKDNGQPFDVEHNGSDTELYSEGLY